MNMYVNSTHAQKSFKYKHVHHIGRKEKTGRWNSVKLNQSGMSPTENGTGGRAIPGHDL